MLKNGLKRLFIVLALLALVMAVLPVATMAQDGGEEGETPTEQIEEAEGGGPLAALGINLGFFIAQVINCTNFIMWMKRTADAATPH